MIINQEKLDQVLNIVKSYGIRVMYFSTEDYYAKFLPESRSVVGLQDSVRLLLKASISSETKSFYSIDTYSGVVYEIPLVSETKLKLA